MTHEPTPADAADPEDRVEREIEDQADRELPDAQTSREAVEIELMDEDDSEAGGRFGEQMK